MPSTWRPGSSSRTCAQHWPCHHSHSSRPTTINSRRLPRKACLGCLAARAGAADDAAAAGVAELIALIIDHDERVVGFGPNQVADGGGFLVHGALPRGGQLVGWLNGARARKAVRGKDST